MALGLIADELQIARIEHFVRAAVEIAYAECRHAIDVIVDDARHLERVLGGFPQLTRVESGLVPNREVVPVEEMVGAALTRMEGARSLEGRDLVTCPSWSRPSTRCCSSRSSIGT